MVAPTPVSALLHAVAVVKAGVFSILKISVYIFGLDLVHQLATQRFLAYVAAFTIIATAIIALRKDNLKARLAYSTIGQLSLHCARCTGGKFMGSDRWRNAHADARIRKNHIVLWCWCNLGCNTQN